MKYITLLIIISAAVLFVSCATPDYGKMDMDFTSFSIPVMLNGSSDSDESGYETFKLAAGSSKQVIVTSSSNGNRRTQTTTTVNSQTGIPLYEQLGLYVLQNPRWINVVSMTLRHEARESIGYYYVSYLNSVIIKVHKSGDAE